MKPCNIVIESNVKNLPDIFLGQSSSRVPIDISNNPIIIFFGKTPKGRRRTSEWELGKFKLSWRCHLKRRVKF